MPLLDQREAGQTGSVAAPLHDDYVDLTRLLFHYTSAAAALDSILTNGTLKLGPPTGLNDPFESGPFWFVMSDDKPESETEGRATMQLFEQASDLLRSRCRLACLSTSEPNEASAWRAFGDGWTRARMWAQYADNHAGVLREPAAPLAPAEPIR